MTTAVHAHPVIGVLGGMGPEATVDFMRRVIAATPARDDGDHIHMIVDCNPKIPSRIAAIIDGTGANPSQELCRMAKSLEAQGAAALVMPCNTAHHYARSIQEAVSIPLLHMPQLTADSLADLHLANHRVGLLASTAVLKLRLYERLLGEHGIQCIAPDDQTSLMAIIRGIKRGETGLAQRQKFRGICDQLMNEDCDVLLIACTELSLFADDIRASTPVMDSLDILVRETCDFVKRRAQNPIQNSVVNR